MAIYPGEKRVYLATLTKEDIGKAHIKRALYIQSINVGSAIGYVQACDVGKHVFSEYGTIVVENSEQRQQRAEVQT